MISLSSDANMNYVATVIRVENIRQHSNADRLQVVTVNGTNAIVDMSVKVGDIMVLCPTESCLCPDFLSANNMFEDAILNSNHEVRGFVNNNGRVRAIRLRGERSYAFLLSLGTLKTYKPDFDTDSLRPGQNFDMVFGEKFIWKYEPPKKLSRFGAYAKGSTSSVKRIADKQFHFHVDTMKLGDNVHKIKPNDYIHVSSKLHGTSGIAANLLVKKKMGFFKEMLFKFFNIPMTEYGLIASSRKVVRIVEEESENLNFYDFDLWKYALEKNFKNHLVPGLSVYYEMVGYVPETGTFIQTNYDYGCKPGTYGIYVYRITYTNVNGDVFEFSVRQIRDWCASHGFNTVPHLYYGKAKNLFPELETTDENWNNKFLEKMKDSFWMEKEDPMCMSKMPYEGVVVRLDKSEIEAYKLKAGAFLQHETKALDKGDVGVEDEVVTE